MERFYGFSYTQAITGEVIQFCLTLNEILIHFRFILNGAFVIMMHGRTQYGNYQNH